MKLKHILFNPKYYQGSLYGSGIFPFWLYIAFWGKPVYKFTRRLGFNRYFSLMSANIIGSASHAKFFSNGILDIPTFIISLITMTILFEIGHRKPKYGVILSIAVLFTGIEISNNITKYLIN